MALRRRGTAEAASGAREVLGAAVMALRQCERGGITTVPVADVLVMLGAGPESGLAAGAPALDPRADMITGCLPVTPRP